MNFVLRCLIMKFERKIKKEHQDESAKALAIRGHNQNKTWEKRER